MSFKGGGETLRPFDMFLITSRVAEKIMSSEYKNKMVQWKSKTCTHMSVTCFTITGK
jgi:hypothetical protein